MSKMSVILGDTVEVFPDPITIRELIRRAGIDGIPSGAHMAIAHGPKLYPVGRIFVGKPGQIKLLSVDPMEPIVDLDRLARLTIDGADFDLVDVDGHPLMYGRYIGFGKTLILRRI